MLLATILCFYLLPWLVPATDEFSNVKFVTRYFLQFRSYYDVLSDKSMCHLDDYKNTTKQLLEKNLTRCASMVWKPKQVSTSQVSWKTTSASQWNKTEENRENGEENDPVASVPSNRKVTKYLVFLVVLPNHPFSQHLLRSITWVGPMFPHISFVVGNGYEFGDFCSQFSVKAFPSLMYFENGKLIEKMQSFNVLKLAVQLARWTKTYPQAIPSPAHISTSNIGGNVSKTYVIYDHKNRKKRSFGWFMSTMSNLLNATSTGVAHLWYGFFGVGSMASHQWGSYVFDMSTKSWSMWWAALDFGPPVEPFMGLTERAVDFDKALVLLCGFYSIARTCYWTYSWSCRWWDVHVLPPT